MNDYSELERLATEANENYPGWYTFDQLAVRAVDEAEFVVMASPETVLALIAENKAMASAYAAAGEREHELRKELAALRSDLSEQCSISNDLAQEASDANELIVELRKKLTTVHFVCDRLPDQDGCRFIELENPRGESLGDESGRWEIRPDGLAQLVVEISAKPGFSDAFYQVAERLGVNGARPVSPMQVFTSEVLPALDKAIKDAERLTWLDNRSMPVVEGQCMSQPEGELWGYDWEVAGQCSTVREAIDDAMSKEASHDQP